MVVECFSGGQAAVFQQNHLIWSEDEFIVWITMCTNVPHTVVQIRLHLDVVFVTKSLKRPKTPSIFVANVFLLVFSSFFFLSTVVVYRATTVGKTVLAGVSRIRHYYRCTVVYGKHEVYKEMVRLNKDKFINPLARSMKL